MNLNEFKELLSAHKDLPDDAKVTITPDGHGMDKEIQTFGFVIADNVCYFDCEGVDVSESVFVEEYDKVTKKYVNPSPEMEAWKEKLDELKLVRRELTVGTLRKALAIKCPERNYSDFRVIVEYDRFKTVHVTGMSAYGNELNIKVAGYTEEVSEDFNKALELISKHVNELQTKQNAPQVSLLLESIESSVSALEAILYNGRDFGGEWD